MQQALNKRLLQLKPVRTVVQLNWKILRKAPKKDIAQWMSKELENLGPTYIKVGQFISTRRDIFGKDISEEFANLRDNVSPLTPEEVNSVIKPLLDNKVITGIVPKPLASASIGQVHKGIIENKHRVVIKIRRPNIEKDIKKNISFLVQVLSVLQVVDTIPNIDDTVEILRDFEVGILKEVDFQNEVNNILLFRSIYKDSEDIYIPRVYKRYCNSDVIVMENVPSMSVTAYTGDRAKLARTILQSFIEQLIQTGTVHGDPHPGNIGVLQDGRIVLYDFGNVVHINYEDRQYLKELIYYLLVSNKSAIITTLKRLQITITNERDMNSYIDAYIDYMKTLDINKINPANISASMGSTDGSMNNRMPFKLTGNFFRLLRVFGALEGLCKELDPKFNYFDVLQNYVSDILFDQDFIVYKTRADFISLVQSNNIQQPPLDKSTNQSSNSKVNLIVGMNFVLLMLVFIK